MSDALAILDPSAIAEALRQAMPDLKDVGTASDFARLNRQTIGWPSGYVLSLAEGTGQNAYQSGHILSQRVTARFGVVWAVRDLGDRMGSIALGEIKAVRRAGMAALCRFAPEGAESTCEPAGGRLVSSIGTKGQMFWQDEFTVAFRRRIQNS